MLRRLRPIYVAVIFAICVTAPGSVSPVHAGGDETANIENGRVIAESRCAHCHAVGYGDKSRISAAPAFRELGKKWPLGNLAEALAEGIVVGHPAMPAFAFTPAEIDDFLGWLDAIQQR